MGRPKKYTEDVIENIRKNMEDYIKVTDIPIVAEFAYQNDVPRQTLYDFASSNEAFSDTIKRLIDKKEAQLEKLATLNAVNPTMAIFSLKQLGWKDKQQTELTGKEGGPIETTNKLDLSALTDEELESLERIIKKTAEPPGDATEDTN